MIRVHSKEVVADPQQGSGSGFQAKKGIRIRQKGWSASYIDYYPLDKKDSKYLSLFFYHKVFKKQPCYYYE